MPQIKYFSHYASDPFFNMAFDEWMFERVISERSAVYLRFYSWKPGAITFGLHQDFDRAVDVSRLGDTAAIRRVTGGRALYHDESEVTYAVAGHASLFGHPEPSTSVSVISRQIAVVLVDFLKRAGIESDLVRQSSHRDRGPDFFHKAPCFASHARFEVAAAGTKIIASAQRIIDKTVFQHGAIKVAGVAQHPALGRREPERVRNGRLNPLDQNTFGIFERHFCAAFADFFDGPWIVNEADDVTQQQVRSRVARVRKNNRMRRDIF
jgi:lipoate-protein ligase A